mgnify:CR=1 FL=1
MKQQDAAFRYLGEALAGRGMVVDKDKGSLPAPTLTHTGLVLDTARQAIGRTDDKWHEARSLLQALPQMRAREATRATIIGRLRSLRSALGPKLGTPLYGLFEVGRLSNEGGQTIGAADLSGDKDEFQFSVGYVARLMEARLHRPPTAARMTFAMTDASDTGVDVVVAEPGSDLEHFCAELGSRHHQSGSSSTERQVLALATAVGIEQLGGGVAHEPGSPIEASLPRRLRPGQPRKPEERRTALEATREAGRSERTRRTHEGYLARYGELLKRTDVDSHGTWSTMKQCRKFSR